MHVVSRPGLVNPQPLCSTFVSDSSNGRRLLLSSDLSRPHGHSKAAAYERNDASPSACVSLCVWAVTMRRHTCSHLSNISKPARV